MKYFILAVIGFVAIGAFAQQNTSFAPPPGFEIVHKMSFTHKDNEALFGQNPLVVLCLTKGEYAPTLLVTKTEALAINGHARSMLVGETFYNSGKPITVTDPHLSKDARAEFMRHMPGPMSRACSERK